jgi:itaconate CoA-transferase
MNSTSSPGLRPLEGLTVVSLEHAIAAPFCTRQLADLGARVIKVERPGSGDFARDYDSRVHGQSSHFVWTNRSKESLTLDLKNPQALSVLMELLAKADVLVQNLAPGAAARMGLSYQALHAKHPRLIVCDISGYGEDGPYRDKKRGWISFDYRRTRGAQQGGKFHCRYCRWNVRLYQHTVGPTAARAHAIR